LQDLNDLQYFAQVVRHGGFSAASRANGSTPITSTRPVGSPGIECQHPISNCLEPDSEDGFAEGWQSIGRPAGVLSRRYRSIPTTTAAGEELARLRTGAPDITVDRLTGLPSRA
jgi:hypothetical protein